MTSSPAVVPYVAFLGASRRICRGWCYCAKEQAAACDGDCRTLNALFPTLNETGARTLIDEVLVATYTTADDQLIEAIRADARAKSAASAQSGTVAQ